jgi:membrane protease YdiL (CAAX protease family)
MQPISTSPAAVLAGLFTLAALGAMLAMWVWTVQQLVQGRRLLPEAKPRIVPWGAGSVGCVVLLVVALDIAASGVLSALAPEAPQAAVADAAARNPTVQLAVVAVRNVLLLVLVPLILSATSRATVADLGLTTADLGRQVKRGLAACLLLAPICYGLMLALSRLSQPTDHPVAMMLRQNFSPLTIVLALLSAAILAPLAEELLFRGVLLGWLESLVHPDRGRRFEPLLTIDDDPMADIGLDARNVSRHPPPTPAVVPPSPVRPAPSAWVRAMPNILTSLLFAALHHAQWPAPIPLFILSLGLGLLYQRTGSLWAPVALHAGFNTMSTVALLLALAAGVPDKAEKSVPPPATEAQVSLLPESTQSEGLRTPEIRQIGLGGRTKMNYDSLPRLPAYAEPSGVSNRGGCMHDAARPSSRNCGSRPVRLNS